MLGAYRSCGNDQTGRATYEITTGYHQNMDITQSRMIHNILVLLRKAVV